MTSCLFDDCKLNKKNNFYLLIKSLNLCFYVDFASLLAVELLNKEF